MSMCVSMFVLGSTTTPAPRMGLRFICEPSMYTQSRGLYFQLWGSMCSILVVACGCIGAGVSL
jgi:hypothetical protein